MVTSIFAGLVFTPLEDVICSRSTMDFTPNLFLFSFSPFLRIFKNTLFKGSLYLARFLLLTIISSWDLALLGKNGGNFSFGILCWLSKFSWAIFWSKNVLRGCRKLGDSSFPHLLLFVNIPRKHLVLKKKQAQDIYENIYATVGSSRCFTFIALFNGRGSRQMRNFPFDFSLIRKLFIQSVVLFVQ